jgi:hypothetical protein
MNVQELALDGKFLFCELLERLHTPAQKLIGGFDRRWLGQKK